MNQPWIEKYRPNKLENIILNETNEKIINNMIKHDNYPNMLFYGPPGTGKTTTILCLISAYQEKHNCKNNYIHLNASHERGVEVIRSQIIQFTNNTTFFKKHHKFVLLDEMDSLTKQAQKQLYIIIKKSLDKDITFILICNYLNKVIPSIKQSLFTLYFNKTSLWCDSYVENCLKQEKKIIKYEYINHLKEIYTHDLRSILNSLQNFQNKELYICNSIFKQIMENSNYLQLYNKLNYIYDSHTILCSFFNYLYINYTLDNETICIMKNLLVNTRIHDYFIENFLPYIREKYK